MVKNAIHEKMINSYVVLVLGGRKTIEEVPTTPCELENGTMSTLRDEVKIRIAEKTIECLG